MACSELFGGGLLGFQQGQAQANQQSQFQGCTGAGNTITTTASSNTIWIDAAAMTGCDLVADDIIVKPRTLREELQSEVDDWLPQLAA